MAEQAKGIEPKTIGLIVAVVLAVGLAVWQGTKSLSGSDNDPSFETKIKPPPDSARPPGFETPSKGGESKTGAD